MAKCLAGLAAISELELAVAEYEVGKDLPKLSEKDAAKMAKRAEKEERSVRLAAEASQVRTLPCLPAATGVAAMLPGMHPARLAINVGC